MENKLECLFGYHKYCKRLVKDKYNNSIHLCKICKLKGHSTDSNGLECRYDYDDKGNTIYYKNPYGFECWYDYDDKDNLIHYKNSDKYEEWHDYDDKGNTIHYKNSDEYEEWFHKGKWIKVKPKNWKYEKY